LRAILPLENAANSSGNQSVSVTLCRIFRKELVMRTVRTHVAQTTLAATMSAMRQWLDQNGNPDIRFETATDEIGIWISLEFPTDSVAYAFDHRFGNTPPGAHKTAA
jgi:hypothetical protein